jgi:hypothetical protein
MPQRNAPHARQLSWAAEPQRDVAKLDSEPLAELANLRLDRLQRLFD